MPVLENLIQQIDEILLVPDPEDIDAMKKLKRKFPDIRSQIQRIGKTGTDVAGDLEGLAEIERIVDAYIKEFG